jgi:Fe-S cluster assembly iron-binding protein IscA
VTLDEFTWPGDIVFDVDGVAIVHAGNLAHLMEDVSIDLVEMEDGDVFTVVSGQSDNC